MPDFEKYLMRHGEGWMQDMIERIERCEGLRANAYAPLEERWAVLMQNVPHNERVAA